MYSWSLCQPWMPRRHWKKSRLEFSTRPPEGKFIKDMDSDLQNLQFRLTTSPWYHMKISNDQITYFGKSNLLCNQWLLTYYQRWTDPPDNRWDNGRGPTTLGGLQLNCKPGWKGPGFFENDVFLVARRSLSPLLVMSLWIGNLPWQL